MSTKQRLTYAESILRLVADDETLSLERVRHYARSYFKEGHSWDAPSMNVGKVDALYRERYGTGPKS